MSWALMLHPHGLQCDLFITHSWKEGLFEMLDKAMYSWPFFQKNAYICFLSNPQNLDIASFICDPSCSPFARALRSASHMLAIPNHTGSIYRRMWCGFEAYLAYTGDKTILTASKPWGTEIWFAILRFLVVLCVGVFVGVYSAPELALSRGLVRVRGRACPRYNVVGWVETKYNGTWSSVCEDSTEGELGSAVCKALGHDRLMFGYTARDDKMNASFSDSAGACVYEASAFCQQGLAESDRCWKALIAGSTCKPAGVVCSPASSVFTRYSVDNLLAVAGPILSVGSFGTSIQVVVNMIFTFAVGQSIAWISHSGFLCVSGFFDWSTFHVGVLLFFLLAEVDSVRARRARDEARQLKDGYTSIYLAECSDDNDRARIHQEINDCIPEVDEVLRVLIKAGISTSGLREAYSRGVDVTSAGKWSLSQACVTPVAILWSVQDEMTVYIRARYLLEFLGLLWLVVFALCPLDHRVFAVNALSRCALPVFACFYAAFPIAQGLGFEPITPLNTIPGATLGIVAFLTSVILAAAGPARTTRLPWLGPSVARFFMGRGCCGKWQRRQRKKLHGNSVDVNSWSDSCDSASSEAGV
eukprot:TRINITY_DN4239_c0_g1_i1.p1 TRINITY_DN4239_c0_g1~~TRINITY_DN4239_c0_g1_i1.p1  ORF type:complete len:668 (+),score=63.30 TRINITY_DN4239_c0_g1_i1:247-2004(+)